MGEKLTLTADDGHRLSAYRATPAGKPRGGLVVVQEIFGVNSHIRNVTDGFAADGYVAIAPALFDRVEREFETGYAPADIERGRMVRGKLQTEDAVKDVTDAVKELQKAGLKVGAGGHAHPRRRRRVIVLRRRRGGCGRRAAEVPGHLPLRRDGRLDPHGPLGPDQGPASQDPAARLPSRPRLQL